MKELLGRQRLTLVLTVFLIELTIFFLAASLPLDAATQQLLQKEAKGLTRASSSSGPTAQFVYIFTHNTVIAFGEMVPVVGSLLWAVSIYATGQIVQAVASSQGAPGALYGLFLLFFPFALVELAAYAVAVSSGVTLIIAWRQRRLRNEVKMLVLEGGVVATMLLAAAAMETVTITDPTLGIALWIPTGLTIAVLTLISSRLWHGVSSISPSTAAGLSSTRRSGIAESLESSVERIPASGKTLIEVVLVPEKEEETPYGR